MSKVGQKERDTQNHVIKLFRNKLKYAYFGNWEERSGNRNIEEEYLRAFLKRQGYSETLIGKAVYELKKVAEDQTRSLYDINKAVYGLLRYGVQVKPDMGENTETVWLINWKDPLKNDFAIAEEVTVKGDNRSQTARCGPVCERHRTRRARAEALDSLGERGHSRESGRPEKRCLSSISSRPYNLLWQAMIPRGYAMGPSKLPRSII